MVPSAHGRTALLLLLLVAAARTSEAVEYTITDLGTLGVQGRSLTAAMDINDAGDVIGADGNTLFLWDPQNGMRDLGIGAGLLMRYRINNAGQITGTEPHSNNDIGAFLWNSPTDVRQLLSPSGWDARAYGINDLGIVVGQGTVPHIHAFHACRWDADGNPHLLAAATSADSSALDINNAGQIIGWSDALAPWPGRRAFLWDETDGIRDLGTLDGGSSSASAINNAGVVVGWVEFDDEDDTVAFIGDSENGMRALESPHGASAKAYDINDAGQIIGTLGFAQPAIWDNGVVVDLQLEVGRPAGWFFLEVRAINASGQIVGWGRNPDNKTCGFLLTPVPEPAAGAMLLCGAVALAVLGRLRARGPG